MRLIDTDALIKNLSYLYTKNHIPIDMRAKEILTTIMEQPTAYDIDKVVGELKKHKDTTDLTTVDEEMVVGFTIYQGAFNDAIDKAIEIVKADGKDEKEKINIMGHNSIEEHKQVAKNTNELLNYLIEIIEQNNKRFSFEWAVGGEHATMEIFDNEKEIGYVVNIEPIKYDETGKAINV